MKTVTEVLSAAKGNDRVNDICTGKGAFSTSGFNDLVTALANDTTYKVKTYDKDGKVTGEVNISEMIRNDVKKTVDAAKYPQKSEAGVLDSSNIVVNGIAKAIPYIVMEQLKCGKKFDLPQQPNCQGSVYLAPQAGGEKTSDVRDIKTNTKIGTSTTKTKDYIQVKTKSTVPNACVISKVRKDLNGKVVNA